MKASAIILFIALCATVFFSRTSCLAANDDPCSTSGITVRNATMLDLWYEKNGGACSILIHEHLFTIRPQDAVIIYSDMDCKTLYCPRNAAYRDYKMIDKNGDCQVRILPDCNLAGM